MAMNLAVLGGLLTEGVGAVNAGETTRVTCPAHNGAIKESVLERVLPLRVRGRLATSFTLEVDHRQYLVTTRRILGGTRPDAVEIEYDEWVTVPVQIVGIGEGTDDVAVLAAEQKLSATGAGGIHPVGPAIGQWLRVLGFAPGVKTNPLRGYARRGAPYVAGGTLSGIHGPTNAAESASIWIEGATAELLSGGPVLYQPAYAESEEECEWAVSSVVSEHVYTAIDFVKRPEGRAAGSLLSASGRMRATSINAVWKLIQANPVGFNLRKTTQGDGDGPVDRRRETTDGFRAAHGRVVADTARTLL